MASDQAAVAAAMERKLEKQRNIYRAMKFTNPYAGIENYFADMENAFEDITVNQQQAQFQGQQGAQQRANIMQGLRGAAGASGIAGLAQTLANQGALQAQQISASIGAQESRNQALAAQAAQQMDVMERRGASAADMADRGGEGMLQQMEMDRQATLLGIAQASSAGANAGLQQAYSNQMAATTASNAATAAAWSSVGQSLGSAAMYYGKNAPTSCFAKGDKVEMFNGTLKAIELIKVGDEIKSIKNNQTVKGIVTNTLIHPTNDVVEVIKINGITAEPKHPVYVDNKWILIEELETTTHQFIDNWYNLEVDGNTGDSEHNYIIGNLVASGSYPERTDSIVSDRERMIKIKQV